MRHAYQKIKHNRKEIRDFVSVEGISLNRWGVCFFFLSSLKY